MKQEEKELLLKDLCARLPYGVKVATTDNDGSLKNIWEALWYNVFTEDIKLINCTEIDADKIVDISEVKPYLFPLSSMTEEQKKEISKRYNYYNPYQLCVLITDHRQGYWDNDDNSCNLQDYLWLEDWFNKHHFDYRGLIPKGLAIDATELNVY